MLKRRTVNRIVRQHEVGGFKRVGQSWEVCCVCGWTDQRSETRAEAQSEHALHVKFEIAQVAEAAGATSSEVASIFAGDAE